MNQKLKQMKKVLFAALLLISTQSMFAQINQGQWLVGGNVHFETGKDGPQNADDDAKKYTTFNFSPNAGYFFVDKLAGGLRLDLYSKKFKEEDDAFTDFSFAPFIRYYFMEPGQKVNVFADASFAIGSIGDEEKTGYNSFMIQAGPAIFVSPNTALEFTLFYKTDGGEYNEDYDFKRFGLNIGFQVHLGGGGGKAKK